MLDACYDGRFDDALAQVRTNRGKSVTDSISSTIHLMINHESARLLERRAVSEQQAQQTLMMLFGGSLAGLFLFVLILFTLNKQFHARSVAEEQLRQGEARFNQFLEMVPTGIFILKSDGTPYFTNEQSRKILGRGISPDPPSGSLSETYKAYRAGTQEIYPDDELPIVRALKGERSTVRDVEIEKDGIRVPLLITGAPIYDADNTLMYSVAAFVDVSAQKNVERQLEESERRHRQIINRATDIIYRTDKRGYFTFVNESGLQLFKYSDDAIKKLRYTDLIRPDMQKKVQRFYIRQAFEQKDNTYLEFPAITSEGRQIYLGQNVTLLKDGNDIEGFQAVARDVTEARVAQEALVRRENQLTNVIELR
jgi:PAS domain S-box-containing protein